MIPFFRITSLALGPIEIQVWGLLVAIGIIAAVIVGHNEAVRRKLNGEVFVDFSSWIVVGAFIMARLFYAVAYDPSPASFVRDPWRIVRIWDGGMSSLGGFIGAMLAALIFVKVKRMPFMPYADVAAYVLPLGYGIGRIGCFLIHDHPGTLSSFFLAVGYPGGARLDHGLLLSIFGFAIFGIFLLKKRKRTGASANFLAWFAALYGIGRFMLDFFRAWDLSGADARYLYLTPAQYGAALMAVVGAAYLWYFRKKSRVFIFS